MDTRLQVRANLLVMFLVVGVSPCCSGEQPTVEQRTVEQPTVAVRPADGAVTPPAPWQPGAGHTQIPLWPGGAPDARPAEGAEVTGYGTKQVAGRPWLYADRVTEPTITVYSPERRNSGAAVIVFPGGGYFVVAIDLEGTEACEWLTSRGITCVLLKYRVPCARVGPYRDCAAALEDAQRAVGLVRARAAEWQIDPNKIGVLGFSAGGHMVAALSTHFERRRYPAVDEADKVSCRPDFAIALYPGHLAVEEENFVLNPDIRVTAQTPPTFLLHATDDPVDPVENSLVYYAALQKAGVPAEMHLYAKGGHAFGLRRTQSPITEWPKLVEDWLKTMGVTER
jgi:acetyl esterase/lipase